jgi:hypothetical protein
MKQVDSQGIGDETLRLIANHLGFLGYDITITKVGQDDECYAVHDRQFNIRILKAWKFSDALLLQIRVSLSEYDVNNVGIQINNINKEAILSRVYYTEGEDGTGMMYIEVTYIGPYVKKNFTAIYDLWQVDLKTIANHFSN